MSSPLHPDNDLTINPSGNPAIADLIEQRKPVASRLSERLLWRDCDRRARRLDAGRQPEQPGTCRTVADWRYRLYFGAGKHRADDRRHHRAAGLYRTCADLLG